MSSLEMLLSDWLWFFHKTILALSDGHFEYFLTLSKNIHTYLRSRPKISAIRVTNDS
jgi:hypothetical protein